MSHFTSLNIALQRRLTSVPAWKEFFLVCLSLFPSFLYEVFPVSYMFNFIYLYDMDNFSYCIHGTKTLV